MYLFLYLYGFVENTIMTWDKGYLLSCDVVGFVVPNLPLTGPSYPIQHTVIVPRFKDGVR